MLDLKAIIEQTTALNAHTEHVTPWWSLFDLTLVPIRTGGQLRNHATVRRILWSKWFRLGEFHCTLSLHNWSMLILPSINVWADLCLRDRLRNRTTMRRILCSEWIEIWWVSFYTITEQLKHVNSTINQCLSWGEGLRNRATLRCILWSKWLRLGVFHCSLSLHNWSMLIYQCLSWSLFLFVWEID